MNPLEREPARAKGTAALWFRLSAFLMLIVAGFLLLAAVDFEPSRLIDSIRGTSPLHFLLLMVALPLIGFPISAFYLYAGSAFPWWQATLLCSLSLALNMAIAYPLAKFLLTAPVSRFMARYRRTLPALTERNQFRVTFLVRSIPGIPYFMQNYMLPLLGVRFPPYLLISWSIQSIFAAGMAALPALVDRTGWVPAGIIAALLVLLMPFRRIYLSRGDQSA